LIEAGIEERYIKTDTYNTYPQYNHPPSTGRPVLRGYEVAHTITVSIKDLEKVETVIGILGTNGASEIMGPNFGFEDDKAVVREARDMAIADAREEAKKLADSLGVDLVRIVSFNENYGGYPMPMMGVETAANQAKDGAGSAPFIPVGSNKVETNVTLVYEIR